MVSIAALLAVAGWASSLLFILLWWKNWCLVGAWRLRAERYKTTLKECEMQLEELRKLYDQEGVDLEKWEGDVTIVQSTYDIIRRRNPS